MNARHRLSWTSRTTLEWVPVRQICQGQQSNRQGKLGKQVMQRDQMEVAMTLVISFGGISNHSAVLECKWLHHYLIAFATAIMISPELLERLSVNSLPQPSKSRIPQNSPPTRSSCVE
ncbi:hypothetical protein JMJ77_0009812 [Colletotrichum scovillei]|uniref:Uncharacterized protein n=1 Tax=Colletotrichum scovillei TaxID=1209932 RepID=A0A9P7R0R3_9PEZI|nr:hypothetical protein JMJ77_0009812 [Colletotrichum scovillei]KAG7052899.1 hypothetical protein JMJ78_0005909 [Colletotrichum scovillei]KAG7065188.1 hypothetical protein JMJ76_0012939 [Colletotrichum scovillei]